MKITRRTAVQLVVVALAALPLTACSYNKFVGQEEAIKSQWAQGESQLQPRIGAAYFRLHRFQTRVASEGGGQ